MSDARASPGCEHGIAGLHTPRQLDDDALVDDVANALHRSGLDPGSLTLTSSRACSARNATKSQGFLFSRPLTVESGGAVLVSTQAAGRTAVVF